MKRNLAASALHPSAFILHPFLLKSLKRSATGVSFVQTRGRGGIE